MDVVLIGGGHSHAIALRMFGMKPVSGLRLALITPASETAYSGMLPGHVAGFYSDEQCQINLCSLAEFAGARLYIDRAIGLDLESKRVICEDRPPVPYDVLSIDVGSTPNLPHGLEQLENVIPAKPVRTFLDHWQRILDQVTHAPDRPLCLAIVGGGAGGVELALNMQTSLHRIFKAANQPTSHLTIHLIHRGDRLLPQHNPWVRQRLHALLVQRGIQIHVNQEVHTVRGDRLYGTAGFALPCDFVIWVTQASAPTWLANAGLAVDSAGFVLVNDNLQSLSHPDVFATGDGATMVHSPRPKAGVFAVRQGKPLFDNLCRTVRGQPLRSYRPPRSYLSLIGSGDKQAIASWGPGGWRSPVLWSLKDWIDRRFLDRLNHPPADKTVAMPAQGTGPMPPPMSTMRCAGCGSKVGSPILERVLQRIQADRPPQPPASPNQPPTADVNLT